MSEQLDVHQENLSLEAMQKQINSLRGQIIAMQEARAFRLSRHDKATERLRHRVADLEKEIRYLKDDVYRVRAGMETVGRNVSHLRRGW